jgi:RNA polymerase sigma-70 factor (ECF subfamily)
MTGLKHRSDEDLYRAVRKGDRGALGELYERREPGLYRYALYASGSRAVAEEVTHDIFLRLIGPGVTFDEQRGSLEAYLYGVARNLLRARPRVLNLDEADEPATDEDALRSLIAGERSAALLAAVRELPAGYRDAVLLCDLEEKSYEEAARLMGCPVGTVRSRLHRARALLSARLKWLRGAGRGERQVTT